jgi:hypothetical protein
MSFSDYLLTEIWQTAEKPTLSEMMERQRGLEPVELDEEHRPESIIRRTRDAENPRDLA